MAHFLKDIAVKILENNGGVHNGAICCEADSNETGMSITFSTHSGQLRGLQCAVCALVQIIRLPTCVWQAMEKAALHLQIDSKA